MDKIAIIGGGAAGMMASIFAARRGAEVHVYEKNEKTGKKLYITGKGRCNLTNACDMEELLESVKSNKKFLFSAFYGFTNENAMDFFEKEGLKLKVERGNRVFPLSDRSADVLDTLRRSMKQAGVQIHLNTEVKKCLKMLRDLRCSWQMVPKIRQIKSWWPQEVFLMKVPVPQVMVTGLRKSLD